MRSVLGTRKAAYQPKGRSAGWAVALVAGIVFLGVESDRAARTANQYRWPNG